MTRRRMLNVKRDITGSFALALVVCLSWRPQLPTVGYCHAFIVTNPRHGAVSRPVYHLHDNVRMKKSISDENDDDDNEEDDFIIPSLPDETDTPLDPSTVASLTITQLKQQIRLRGLKVKSNSRKADLIEQLLSYARNNNDADFAVAAAAAKKQQAAKEKGARLVDVTEYLDESDIGKHTRSVGKDGNDDDDDILDAEFEIEKTPEVWGADARIVDDYEGRQVVVDGLSRTVVQYKGSNQTYVSAYVVASRDALKPFLAGKGINATNTAAEERLYDIQRQREKAARRPVHPSDYSNNEAAPISNEGDESGIYDSILDRDFADWGKYTATGAQLSSSEVQGVLLLSDVYGAFTDYTRALAEKIAFECQPVVVMVPDMFNQYPWTGNGTAGLNEDGQTYEQWRALHPDLRVSVNVRAAAACLRERYGVSCVVVWGTCYGGGRALEAASGVLPDDGNIHDVDGSIGPPTVDPVAAIAWYPTRYDTTKLFGKHHEGTRTTVDGKERKLSVMSIFAELDTIPGATVDDADALKGALENDERVNDHMVKVFKGQDHGFAHRYLGKVEVSDPYERFVDEEFGGAGRVGLDGGDAEVACLLSTAFMETYSRVFLPTVGPPISKDMNEAVWGQSVTMDSFEGKQGRDVRREIEDALDNFVEAPLGGRMVDPTNPSQEEELKKILMSMEDVNTKNGPYAIEDDDDLATVYKKLISADNNFQIF